MTTSLKVNTLYNLAGSVVPIVVSLVTVPLFLHLIGVEKYGVLAIVWLFLGYFGIFDLGIGMASANLFAKLDDMEDINSVFWTAIWLNTFLGLVGGAILYLLGNVAFEYWFKMSSPMHDSVISTLPWMALTVPVITVSGVFSGYLDGRQKFLLLNSLGVVGTFFLQVVPLFVAYVYGANLDWIIPGAIIARIVFGAIPMGIISVFAIGIFNPVLPKKCWIKMLLGYGTWTTISGMITPLTSSLDKFMLGSILGPAAVTFFAIPERLARQGAIIPGAVTRALFPRLSGAEENDAHATTTNAFNLLLYVQTPMICGIILVLQPFLGLWVGWTITDKAGPVGLIIAATVWIVGLNYLPSMLLQARGRPDIAAKLRLMEIIPYVIVLWLSIHYFHLIGGGLALLFVNVLDMALLFWGAKLTLYRNKTLWKSVGWILLSEFVGWNFVSSLFLWYVIACIILISSCAWAVYESTLIRESAINIIQKFTRLKTNSLG